MAETILEVKDLSITFFTKQGALPTVDGVSSSVAKAQQTAADGKQEILCKVEPLDFALPDSQGFQHPNLPLIPLHTDGQNKPDAEQGDQQHHNSRQENYYDRRSIRQCVHHAD